MSSAQKASYQAIEGYTTAVFSSGQRDASSVAGEIESVRDLILNNAELRMALTDSGVPPSARRGLLLDLLDGKVSDEVRRAIGFVAASVGAPEVPIAISALGQNVGRFLDPMSSQGTASLSLLASRKRVGGFALALFEDLDDGELNEVEDELFRLARTVETTSVLRVALCDSNLPATVRAGVIDDLIEGRVQPATHRLVSYAVVAGRVRDFVGTLHWLAQRTAEARGWRIAEVYSGRDIEPGELHALSGALSKLSGFPVQLQTTIDPTLLAGILVRIGDLQVDATARSRIEKLKEHMVGGGLGR